MDSYFFVPANRQKFLTNSRSLKSKFIIFDLEDGIYNSDLSTAIQNIIKYDSDRKEFIRLNLDFKNKLQYIKRLIESGFYRFVLPKIENKDELDYVVSTIKGMSKFNNTKFEFILLIESPLALVNIQKLINNSAITAVALGSHDYCSTIGMQHDLENLIWARMNLLNMGRAFGKKVIDIASMHIKNEHQFRLECQNGINFGFDGKFIIHPKQLDILNTFKKYTHDEYLFAQKVMLHISKNGGIDNFTIANIDGIVVERPHLKRIKDIIKQF